MKPQVIIDPYRRIFFEGCLLIAVQSAEQNVREIKYAISDCEEHIIVYFDSLPPYGMTVTGKDRLTAAIVILSGIKLYINERGSK